MKRKGSSRVTRRQTSEKRVYRWSEENKNLNEIKNFQTNELEWLYFKRRWLAGYITRLHQHACIKPQTIGHHTYGVAQIVRTIYPECSKELLLKALDHDADELTTGDVPHPVKKFKEIGTLLNEYEKDFLPHIQVSDEEFQVLKIADMLEFVLYIHFERLMGNQTLIGMEMNALAVLNRLYSGVPEAVVRASKMLVFRAIQGQFHQDERSLGAL